MKELEDGHEMRRAVVQSHRCLYPLFTPTHLTLRSISTSDFEAPYTSWQSRRSRKGRYSPVAHLIANKTLSHRLPDNAHTDNVAPGSNGWIVNLRAPTGKKLKPHFISDVTTWLAVTFTIGSALWVVNGFLVWFPVLMPRLGIKTFTNTAAAIGFLGGSVFELGSYLMVLEALKHGRETATSTALGQMLNHHQQNQANVRTSADHQACHGRVDIENSGASSKDCLDQGTNSSTRVLWGKPLWHDIGYVAALTQLGAATIFWISTLTALPGVIKGLYGDNGSLPIIDVFFWTPQVVGGTGFIISSSLLMLETQTKWYKPNLVDIGWWIGAWNLVGSIGFTLCGAFGYASDASSGAAYESALSTWWGGWAFLIGSVLQLGEAIWREEPDVS